MCPPVTTDKFLLSRLLEFYDPEMALLGKHISTEQVDKAKPIARYVDSWDRKPTARWHLGRIKFFLDKFRNAEKIDPIEVDNEVWRDQLYGPVVIDGHHRLIAAKLAGKQKIDCHYAGRVDFLRYLTGKRQKTPAI